MVTPVQPSRAESAMVPATADGAGLQGRTGAAPMPLADACSELDTFIY